LRALPVNAQAELDRRTLEDRWLSAVQREEFVLGLNAGFATIA